MEATVLNSNFEAIKIIDTFGSFIWTDRYDEAGDFKIYLPINKGLPDGIQQDYYLWNANSEHVMIIEKINIETDAEEIPYCIISGRCLKSMLNRRIIWNHTTFSRDDENDTDYNLQDAIELLLKENVIEPAIVARRIPNFIFEKSNDEFIKSLTIEAQYHGEDLYDTIKKLCQENGIGFKITLEESEKYAQSKLDSGEWTQNQADAVIAEASHAFIFKLINGTDRSYNQIERATEFAEKMLRTSKWTQDEVDTYVNDAAANENPYVVFAPSFGNILNTSYVESKQTLKNVALVGGEGEGTERTMYVVGGDNIIGMDRREIFADANSVSSNTGEDSLTVDQYYAHLKQKGIDTLIENVATTAFEGEIDTTRMYKYGEDFFIGDIVQIANEYGQEGIVRVTEFIMSHEKDGISTYPTFKTIQEGEYDA